MGGLPPVRKERAVAGQLGCCAEFIERSPGRGGAGVLTVAVTKTGRDTSRLVARLIRGNRESWASLPLDGASPDPVGGTTSGELSSYLLSPALHSIPTPFEPWPLLAITASPHPYETTTALDIYRVSMDPHPPGRKKLTFEHVFQTMLRSRHSGATGVAGEESASCVDFFGLISGTERALRSYVTNRSWWDSGGEEETSEIEVPYHWDATAGRFVLSYTE